MRALRDSSEAKCTDLASRRNVSARTLAKRGRIGDSAIQMRMYSTNKASTQDGDRGA